MNKIVIIGGGASGLIASIYAKTSNNQVILLEKNDKCGKKILVTGNGKCNYFNEDFTIEHYNSQNPEILQEIITTSNKEKTLKFWESLGIVPKIKNNYYYPSSNLAVTIQNALILEAKLQGVDIRTNSEVKDIKYYDNKFIITTVDEKIISDKLVIASGSKAAPVTGSDGFSYFIAKKFNHSLIEPLPALVQLRGEEPYFKDWNGIRTDAKITLLENKNKIAEEIGELQLTDYGVSGICIFQISGRVARGLSNNQKETIIIDFLPYLKVNNKDEFITWIDNRNKLVKNRTIMELLEGMLNYKIINIILKELKISNQKTWSNLTTKEKISLYLKLKSFPLDITSTNSFNKAQVCSGGIPLTEINIHTMESLKQKDLYIIGESLDVDGKCGGYNLGFAWLSGLIAGTSIKGEKND